MNSSIKRRQTLLINWLAKVLNCKPITKAETGSYYTEFNTLYTGKSVIRISDHLSGDRSYIHVILSPLNTTVVINYKNFIWNGCYTDAKQIIYALIMSKAMSEQSNPIPNNTIPIKTTTEKTIVDTITKAEYTELSLAQKEVLKKRCGFAVADGWKKIRGKLSRKEYEIVKDNKDIITVRNPTKSITKSQILQLNNPSIEKEILGWINYSKQYNSIAELPCETLQISENQYKTLKSYL